MKNVIVRAISGSIYVLLLIGAVLSGGIWLVALLCLLAALGIYEFICMTKSGKFPRITTAVDIALSIFLIIASWFITTGGFSSAKSCATVALVLLIARLVGQLYTHNPNSNNSLGSSLAAYIYIALPLAFVPLLYNVLLNAHLVLAILIFIWVNDTGAFCVGCLIGKHKLFERISPKKTWEGFFGGMIFCVGAALIMSGCFTNFFNGIGMWQMCKLSIVVSIFATFGDLIESQIKRTAGVKDSSHLIPGHGGILDRIDSLLLVVPACVAYFSLI